MCCGDTAFKGVASVVRRPCVCRRVVLRSGRCSTIRFSSKRSNESETEYFSIVTRHLSRYIVVSIGEYDPRAREKSPNTFVRPDGVRRAAAAPRNLLNATTDTTTQKQGAAPTAAMGSDSTRKDPIKPDGSRKKLRSLKITVVGDGMVGKTCMLITYTSTKFPTEYVPTVFDNYSDNIILDGQEYNMCLWDTAGQEDYERLRILSYPNTNCFLLCYSVDNRSSFENIASKWYPEIKRCCSNTPIVLIGTKTDLRLKNPDGCVTREEGKKMKKKIGAVKNIECSALNNEGLDAIFVEAVQAAVGRPKRYACSSFCFRFS
ncbi:Small GTPase superfamily, Rho type,Small GTP-binding protein domain,P-loop containing nucleoside [Cinara cedri]|uniref:Small GTPase superfamily, Rho type,Small GTP-binding protein domain,P-loop containing nucleoside n=1 Tax=Cinara cedri TaxID=506608 RepID=A0A5E4MQG6_9HEMI|nr:Small GTPase superfamily, Rho type,Small GTP-binding protein domain,P-loop containing nucleoside [Cinara cedri]